MYIQSVYVLISAEIYNRIISFQYYFRITYVYPVFDDKDAVFPVKRMLVQSSIVDFSGLTYTLFSRSSCPNSVNSSI